MLSFVSKICIEGKGGNYTHRLDEEEGFRGVLRDQHGDNYENVAFLITTWTSLLADSPLSLLRRRYTIHRFVKALYSSLFETIRSFSALAHELTRSLRHYASEGTFIGPFCDGMKETPVFQDYLHFTKTGDPQVLRYLLTFLNFGKKLSYKNDELETNALSAWFGVEDKLSLHVWPSGLDNLEVVVKYIMKDFEVGAILPKHGGGAVAEKGVKGTNMKNGELRLTKGLRQIFCRPQTGLLASGSLLDSPYQDSLGSEDVASLGSGIARLTFVPKTFEKLRSINMEEVAYQWSQQAVRLWIENHLSSKSCLKRHVFLHDQSVNRAASQLGSLTGEADTIDLSSASDSVALDLIRRVFPAGVLRYLLATRSKLVELPDGEQIETYKFAPMGSALCFPIQSILYSAIVIMTTISDVYARDWKEPGSFQDLDIDRAYKYCFVGLANKKPAHFPFRVFGDDIVCDTRATSSIIATLSELCFQVNEEKSFIGPEVAFRESCGGFHYDGHDVTPLVMKIKPLAERMKIESVAGVIDLANEAWEYGYWQLRRHLIQFLQYHPIEGVRKTGKVNPILFTDDKDESMAIYCIQPRNSHLRMRDVDYNIRELEPNRPKIGEKPVKVDRTQPSNVTYQRSEVRSIYIGPKVSEKRSLEYERYQYTLWWRARYGLDGHYRDKHLHDDGYGTDNFTSDPTAPETLVTGIKWRWTARR